MASITENTANTGTDMDECFAIEKNRLMNLVKEYEARNKELEGAILAGTEKAVAAKAEHDAMVEKTRLELDEKTRRVQELEQKIAEMESANKELVSINTSLNEEAVKNRSDIENLTSRDRKSVV